MPDCNCVESPAWSHRSCGPSERGRTGQPPAAGWGRGPCVPGEHCRQLDYLPAANGLHADVAPRRSAYTPAERKHPGRFCRPRRSCTGQRPHRARSPRVQLPGLATRKAGPAQARRMGRTAPSAASDRRLGRTWRQAAATLHRRQDRRSSQTESTSKPYGVRHHRRHNSSPASTTLPLSVALFPSSESTYSFRLLQSWHFLSRDNTGST